MITPIFGFQLNTRMKTLSIITLVLFSALSACSPKQEKVEKKVTVEMTVSNDSTAEATVTVTTDSAGNEVQSVKIIKGTPESVKTTVEQQKK